MPTRDLKETVYHSLHEKLINCEYPPASMLNEVQLAEEFGISRTPIREALGRLQQDGYIRILPKKGIYVTDVTMNDALQIFQTRAEIEPIAVRLAGSHLPADELEDFYQKFTGEEPNLKSGLCLDTAMHLFIIEHCGNRYIIDLMHRVFNDNTRMVIATKQNEVKIHDARQEHRNILQLLIQQKYEEAEKAMRLHIESCRNAAMNYFYTQQVYVEPDENIYKKELKKVKEFV